MIRCWKILSLQEQRDRVEQSKELRGHFAGVRTSSQSDAAGIAENHHWPTRRN